MKLQVVVAALAVSALSLALASAAPARGHERSAAVSQWIEVELAEIASHRTNPPRAARGLLLVSVAMRDASNVPGRYRRAAVGRRRGDRARLPVSRSRSGVR